MPNQFSRLSRDTRPQEQPPGSYPFGKNGVQDYIKGSVHNELGFFASAATIPYTPVGVLETDKFPIIFSTNNVNSALGFYDIEQDVYTPILDDISLGYSLGFDTAMFITGQTQRNYKGELVGAFTDKKGKPFYINFDNPEADTLNDLMLFPNALPPQIVTEVLSGGSLLPGAYYVAVKYLKKDGSEIGFVAISSPKIVTGDLNVASDKAIGIHITNIDPDYPKIQVAIIAKRNGVFTAEQFLYPLPVTGTLDSIYTGSELTESITLEEILTPRVVYDRVGTIGQLNDSLYIADLHTPPQLKMQKYAALVRVKWHSKLITVDPVYQPMADGSEKSMMHEEVYALYMRYKLNNGGTTELFPLVGAALTGPDSAASTPGTAEGLTAKKFQVEDTIPSFDLASKSGYCGKWENATETYPNTDDYNASLDINGNALGGPDLRGQKVRHFRMPSINWCKQNLYASEAGYGKDSLDMLGISVENVIIPTEYAATIVGYELFFAKRNVLNSTVIGQSIMLMGQRSQLEAEFGATSYASTGGNWEGRINFKSANTQGLWQEQKIFHFYAFDMLFNKPSITPDYLGLKLKFKYPNMRYDAYAYVEDQEYSSPNDAPIVFNLDYLERGAMPTIPFKLIKRVQNTQYVPNNANTGKWLNKGIETFFGGELANPERLIPLGEIGTVAVQPNSRKDFTPRENIPESESCMLANLMTVRKDLFNPLNGQTLVRMGQTIDLTSSPTFYAGDTYICEYTFHTYGIPQFNADQSDSDPYGAFSRGTRVARRFVCETAANLYARYEDPANQYSRYYPKSPLTPQDVNGYLSKFLRNNDPNQFGYKKDSNALDDLVQGVVFNPYVEDITDHPYRIHRGGKLSRQTKVKTWRTFLPLDYYELQKNMGKPIHIEGMDDRLLIHHENALFLTQDKTKLESDIIAVTLGSGDIFQFPPQEGHSAKLGYAGTQHELACVRTPFGYVFVESKSGQVFLYKGELKIMNEQMNSFFQENLRLKEINPLTGNGYTIGYDEKFKRILLTAKNRQVATQSNIPEYDEDLIGTYVIGQLLIKDGRYVRFLGVNATIYNCYTPPVTTASNYTQSIAETLAVGTVIGNLTGANVLNYFMNGNTSPFSISPTGQITVTSPLTLPTFASVVYNFSGTATGSGNSVAFTVAITVTPVNQAPMVTSAEVTINDTATNGSAVATIVATDRESDTLTYGIASGNISSAFAINTGTGAVTVNDATQLNALLNPRYELLINVSDSGHTTQGTLVINLTHIDKPPVVTNSVLTMFDTAPNGTVIGYGTLAVDPEGATVVYTLVSQTAPAVMTIDTDDLKVTLLSHALLNPATSYVFNMTAYDGVTGHAPVAFTVTVNVIYDRANLKFEPANPSCVGSGPVCATGYTLSSDGTTCTKVTTVAADMGSGSPITLQHFSYSQYAQWGTILYPVGTYGTNGAPSVKPNTTLINTTSPLYAGKPGGEATVINTLWTNTTTGTAQDGSTGRLNRTGVWKNANQNYTGTLGISRQFNVPTTGNYWIGVGSDDAATISVNGTAVVTQNLSAINSAYNTIYGGSVSGSADLFRYWHVYQVALNAGINIISVTGNNTGSLGLIGVEIYSGTAANLIAVTTESALATYKIFSTAAPSFGSISNGDASDVGLYNCSSNPTYTLVYDAGTNSYSCQLVATATPTSGTNTRHWDKVNVRDIERNVVIQAFNNQATPVLTFQDLNVPYYPDVVNSIDCGASVVLYLSAMATGSAQRNNCPSSIGSVVAYSIPIGQYGSVVSQATADASAAADVAANKQAYANTNGTCS